MIPSLDLEVGDDFDFSTPDLIDDSDSQLLGRSPAAGDASSYQQTPSRHPGGETLRAEQGGLDRIKIDNRFAGIDGKRYRYLVHIRPVRDGGERSVERLESAADGCERDRRI